MKKLRCEICGSCDILKDGDFFVCQACGCKYMINDVKKIIVEGNIDVSGGSVQIENLDSISAGFTSSITVSKAKKKIISSSIINIIISVILLVIIFLKQFSVLPSIFLVFLIGIAGFSLFKNGITNIIFGISNLIICCSSIAFYVHYIILIWKADDSFFYLPLFDIIAFSLVFLVIFVCTVTYLINTIFIHENTKHTNRPSIWNIVKVVFVY